MQEAKDCLQEGTWSRKAYFNLLCVCDCVCVRPFLSTNGGGMSCWNIAARTDSRASWDVCTIHQITSSSSSLSSTVIIML